MRPVAMLLIFGFILITGLTTKVEAADTKVIRISVTIPAIVGLNWEDRAISSSKTTFLNQPTISQTEQRKVEKKPIILKTILLK